ncbi:MAG: hypothetical protein QG612_2706 [Pseudomonadota bacterium]|nr:hypothetical protein [Pseudomonadota bacterium]
MPAGSPGMHRLTRLPHPEVAIFLHAGSYDVVVSNSVGSVTRSAVALTVTTTTSGALATSATTAAQAFLATLSTTQQAQVQQAWSLDTARRWSNLPASMVVSRNGLSWSSLSTAQRTAARALIATALSSTGDTLHQGLQAADDYLYASGAGSSYGSGNYHIALLGTPSTSGFWLLSSYLSSSALAQTYVAYAGAGSPWSGLIDLLCDGMRHIAEGSDHLLFLLLLVLLVMPALVAPDGRRCSGH